MGSGSRENSGSVGRVRVAELRCSYGRVTVVHDTAMEVSPGQHVALLGANGSGKSTLLRAIGGLHRHHSGSVELDGVVLSPAEARKRCAWVPQRQNPGRFPLLVSELLDSARDPSSARDLSERLRIADLWDRPLSTLSGGQLQRAFLARGIGSLGEGVPLLLADEPSAALDFDGQREVAELLRELGATLIMATHDRVIADTCDRRFEMAAGVLREIT